MALGVILTPYGANGPGWYADTGYAYGGKGTYLPQPGPYPLVDRFHNTRGEVGLYYDTQLGAIPTDAELATVYQCYTPVASGWINAKEGYITPPWRFGWDPAGKYGPPTSLSGLGVTTTGNSWMSSGFERAINHIPLPLPTALKVPAILLAGASTWLAYNALTKKDTTQAKRAIKLTAFGTAIGWTIGLGTHFIVSGGTDANRRIGAWQQENFGKEKVTTPPDIIRLMEKNNLGHTLWTGGALVGSVAGLAISLTKGL